MRKMFVSLLLTYLCSSVVVTKSFRTNCLEEISTAIHFKHTGQCIAGTNDLHYRKNAIEVCKIGFNGMKNGRLVLIGTNGIADLFKPMLLGIRWVGLAQVEEAVEPDGGWQWVDSRNGMCCFICF